VPMPLTSTTQVSVAYVHILYCIIAKWLKNSTSTSAQWLMYVQPLRVHQLSVKLTHGEAKMHFNRRGHIFYIIFVIVLL
jgi:hypothetical protein